MGLRVRIEIRAATRLLTHADPDHGGPGRRADWFGALSIRAPISEERRNQLRRAT